MKQLLIIAISLTFAIGSMAQTYATMWKKVSDARNKDLPRTELQALAQISYKASREKAYGHLLKAQLSIADLQMRLSPDSADAEKAKLSRLFSCTKDKTLKAVYATVLARIYENGDTATLNAYRKAALADMDLLAKMDADGFAPLIVNGKDSEIFGDDLLSVIGFATKQYQPLYSYYKDINRRAACIAKLYAIKDEAESMHERLLKKSVTIARLDSLTHTYGDLDVAGEVAVERYNYMGRFNDVTLEDRIGYINNALQRWGTWQRAGELRNAQKQLTASTLSIHLGNDVGQPNKVHTLNIKRIRNISELHLNVYPTTINANTEYVPDYNSGYKYLKPMVAQTPVQTINRHYASHPDYAFFEDSVEIQGLPVGVYLIETKTVPQTQTVRRLFYVTDMGIVYIALPDSKRRIVVVNTTTGLPIAGAKLEVRYGKDKEKTPHTILSTDKNGEIIVDEKNKSIELMRAFTDKDKAAPMRYAYAWFSYNDENGEREMTNVFTDRAIYRPGQTVHAAAILFKKKTVTDYEVIKGKQVEAILRDANYKEIAKKNLMTDDYGSCATDFVLPQSTLNGYFTLQVNNSSTSFRVESYKRPTFIVEFPKINEKYALGDTLVVKAKANTFAGNAVQGAAVTYEVTRRTALWWRWGGYSPRKGSEQVFSGEATTDSNGNFDITIPLVDEVSSTGNNMILPRFYNFTATVSITDLAGETHTSELDVPIGSKATAFTVDIADKILAGNLKKVTFNLYNATGANISADVKYQIDGGQFEKAKTTELIDLGNLASGKHEIYAICEVDTLKKSFAVFNLDDTKPAVETDDWWFTSNSKFTNDGDPITIQVGSSANDVHLLYTLIAENRLIESGAIDKNGELLNRKLLYKQEYGNAVRVDFVWVKDGKYHTHSVALQCPTKPTNLKMEWTTFRDRLVPGQNEEWTLRITNPDGTSANAQALLTMYDKALDQIHPHTMEIYKARSVSMPQTSWGYARNFELYGNAYRLPSRMAYHQLYLSHFDDDIYPFYGYGEVLSARGYIGRPTRGGIMRAKEVMSMEQSADNLVYSAFDTNGNDVLISLDSATKPEEVASESKATVTDKRGSHIENTQMRENLHESAFFMPQLLADNNGEVKIKFTLPECLTTWRLLGVSHTQDMMTGEIDGDVVASKSLMVIPNMPRFIRHGDYATIVARIINNVDSPMTGSASMTLIDPATEEIVKTLTTKYEAKPNGTTTALFSFDVPANYQLLICKVSAESNGFSDGEQHYLPVLSDNELITKTLAFSSNPPKEIKVDKNCYRLTLEYTENPEWLAYQALPQISSPDDDNAISLAASIYANALGRKIVADAPSMLKNQFEQWRNDGSLISNLSKNEELKDVIINETPWLTDATNETEAKQRMGEFFDSTAIDYRIETAAQKLAKLQKEDNMWSWWKGMSGSPYITAEILKMMARLETLGISIDQLRNNIKGARSALEHYMIDKVRLMKGEEAKGVKIPFPGGVALDYLYINAISTVKLSTKAKAANDYLIDKLQKEIKNQSIGDKAVSAIILDANGNKTTAKQYAQSIKEYTVYNDDMGRYYDTPKADYSWRDYRIPTQVAAIEAIQRIVPNDTVTTHQMLQWLLMQKCTQAWDTPINTVNAIYALSNGFHSRGFTYVKKSYNYPKDKSIATNFPTNSNIWGAVYSQYWQKAKDVESSSMGLSIKREVFDKKGNHIESLKVGDKIKVRLTIKANRDFDFVSVIDRRAACMEPVAQNSGYHFDKYESPKDNATYYYYDTLKKGTHIIETEYTIDRQGSYSTGTATAQCAYAPEFKATTGGVTINVF